MAHQRNDNNKPRERVLLVSCFLQTAKGSIDSLDELARLTETAGGEVVGRVLQERSRYEPATLIGSGKVAEIAEQVKQENIEVVIFDQELTPSQNRNLEKAFKIRVLDRTSLILDIFALHATSREGKLQVELAQLNYMMTRLVGQVSHWSRPAGGIGTSGPGETLLEMERRRFRDRVARLKKELAKVQAHRDLQRQRRVKVPIPTVSLVGYTNAGKSSLLNRLSAAEVLVEDTLFATLDPTVRRVRLPSGRQFLLADTVGFVRKLPHQLIVAFKSTLQEIGKSSLLLHVIDSPEAHMEDQVETVGQVLEELGYAHYPLVRVFNKMDCQPVIPNWLRHDVPSVCVSAKTGEGLSDLLEKIDECLSETAKRVILMIPHGEGSHLADIYRSCRVLEKSDEADGVRLTVEMGQKFLDKYSSYIQT